MYQVKHILSIFYILVVVLSSQGNKPVYTQVTFMYDIKRDGLNAQFKRTYQYYLSYFDQMLQTDSNLIVFGEKDLQAYVWQRRKQFNTVFVHKKIETFKQLWNYPYVEKIRQKRLQDPNFPYKQYPQFALQLYNPIIMSKLYMLTYALQYDKFNTDILIWTDGGYMHQFPRNVISPDNLIKKIYQLMQPQWLFYTYYDSNMFLGYEKGSERYISRPVQANESIIASNFGGYIETLRDVRCTYENFLRIVLQNGDMNSDESVLSMMPIKFPYLFPNTFGLYINELYQKFHIYMDNNRKPEHSRNFRANLDNEESIQAIDQTIIITKSTNPNVMDEVALYKKIFQHELIFLLAMITFYLAFTYRRFKQNNQIQIISLDEHEDIIQNPTKSTQ